MAQRDKGWSLAHQPWSGPLPMKSQHKGREATESKLRKWQLAPGKAAHGPEEGWESWNGREELAGLIGGHCPWTPSPVAEESHGNSGAGQGSLQSQSTTVWAAQQPTGKGVTAREKNSLWKGLSTSSPTEQGKGTAVLPEPPCRGAPSCPFHGAKTISMSSGHAQQGGSVTAGHWILSHRSSSAWSVPRCALALAVGRGAECEVVAEQQQGVEALEPLQCLRQQRDSDSSARAGEVCHQLLKARNPPQQLRHQPQLQRHVAEVLHAVQGRVQQEGERLHQGMGQLCYWETWGQQHSEDGLGHILAKQEKGKENSQPPASAPAEQVKGHPDRAGISSNITLRAQQHGAGSVLRKLVTGDSWGTCLQATQGSITEDIPCGPAPKAASQVSPWWASGGAPFQEPGSDMPVLGAQR